MTLRPISRTSEMKQHMTAREGKVLEGRVVLVSGW